MIDNSNINQKINIRQKGLFLATTPFYVIDMFAGEGLISKIFWNKISKNLIIIEQEQSKIDKINFDCIKICGDNRNYIELTKNCNIVDLDAYGLLFDSKIINKILEYSECDKLIYFTESNPFSKKIEHTIFKILELNPDCFFIEKANNSSVFYGYMFFRKK